MKTTILFICVILLLMNCGGKNGDITVQQQAAPSVVATAPQPAPAHQTKTYYPNDSTHVALLNDAFELLNKTCGFIKNYTEAATEITLHYDSTNSDYRDGMYGWKRQITITMKISNDEENIPFEMAGQTLDYFMGIGKKPGIVVNKWQAGTLCGYGKDVWPGEDVFIPVEAVAGLRM
jgi:hypothetical protein